MSLDRNIKINDFHQEGYTFINLRNLLEELDFDFSPNLSHKVNLTQYAHKLNDNSKIFVAKNSIDNNVLGIVAFYCNDIKKEKAYIPIIWVSNMARGKGVGKMLLEKVISYLEENGFLQLELETWDNSKALRFYKTMGFKETHRVTDRPGHIDSVFLIYKFGNA